MDKPSTARYAAYLNGRGAEYEETIAARAEVQKQRGEPTKSAKRTRHEHSHSPLSDPAVYARRRAAAAKSQKGTASK